MHRKRLLCWKAYLPRSSWPTQPTTPTICARPSLPKARSPSSPTTPHGRSNIRSTSISMPSAISWSAASQNSNNSAASQPASKRQPEITLPSSLSQPSSYGTISVHTTLERQTNPSARFKERRCYIDKPSGSFASNLKFPLSREPDSNSSSRLHVILRSCLVDFGDWSPLEFDEISDERKLKPVGQAERPTCPHCGPS